MSELIAISGSDYHKYGCPSCNCIYGVPKSLDWSYITKCKECGMNFEVIADGYSDSGFRYGKDSIKAVFVDHPNKKRFHYYIRPDIKPEVGEYFKPRGVGYDLAGFVESRLAGERIINMFKKILGNNIKTWLDYRNHEPDWIQVKVQKEDRIDLEKLDSLTQDNIITEDKILQSLK
jgi:hypothetical protein